MSTTLVTTALLTYLLAPADWSAEAKKRINAIRTAGEPTSLPTYADAYYRVGKGQNAAIPYSKAFSLLARLHSAGDDTRELPVVGLGPIPTPPERLSDDALQKVKQYLDARREVLALVDAAASMDRCVFDLDFTPEGTVLGLGHRNSMREMAKLICLEALYCTETADTCGAARALRNVLSLTHALRNEPGVIAFLVCEALRQLALTNVERLVWRAECTPTDLRGLQHVVGEVIEYRALERATMADRCFTVQMYRQLNADPAALKEAQKGFAIAPDRDFCYALDIMEAQLKILRLPYPQSLLEFAAKHPKDDSAMDHFRLMVKSVLKRDMVGMLEAEDMVQPGIFSQSLPLSGLNVRILQRHIAQFECTRSTLAAARFHLQQGRFPDRLTELVPKFIESVPLDPFDGKPIRYKRVGNGFAVYSVGENLADDGAEGKLLRQSPDIVFRSFPPAR